MPQTLADVRHAARRLLKTPAFTAVAVLTLALGIGANTAIFSAIHAVLLTPPALGQPDRLAMVWMDNEAFTVRQDVTSYPSFLDWRDRTRTLSDLAAFRPGQRNLTGEAEPERLAVTSVTANFFQVAGATPERGRQFNVDEEQPGQHRVALLGHGLWQRRFGGDPTVVGQTVQLNEQSFEIVGVMPPGFDFPERTQLWVPLAPGEQLREARQAYWLYTLGRLRPGVTMDAAQADMSRVAAELGVEYPDAVAQTGIYVQPVTDYLTGAARPALLVLFGAVAFLLLIACANVANLFLARATTREREIAVRAALGAPRGRLIRHMLAESVLLGIAGGVAGALVAIWAIGVLRELAPADLPGLAEMSVNLPVLAFTMLIAAGTGLLFGIVPALQLSSPGRALGLREGTRGLGGSRGGNRLRRGLVVGEVALALVLLIGAGLLIQSFRQINAVDTGFQAENVLTARIALSGSSYAEGAQVVAFYDDLLARLQGLPGVSSVAATSDILLAPLPASAPVTVEGRPTEPGEEGVEIPFDVVTTGYFATVGTPLLRGRDFAPSDVSGGDPVVIVNEAMAQRYWNGDALGRRFRYGPETEPWLTVVGVVADARRTAIEQEARPSAFFPHSQFPASAMSVVVRTTRDPLALAPALRAEVRAVDSNIPIAEISTLQAQLGERLAQRRFNALLLGLFSALALLLALVGVYGVISYMVGERRREIGIRMALGARQWDVLRLVAGQMLALVVVGVAVGLLAALGLTRTLESLLFEVSTTDPGIFVLISALMAAVAAVASYIPARAATRVDPNVALRQD